MSWSWACDPAGGSGFQPFCAIEYPNWQLSWLTGPKGADPARLNKDVRLCSRVASCLFLHLSIYFFALILNRYNCLKKLLPSSFAGVVLGDPNWHKVSSKFRILSRAGLLLFVNSNFHLQWTSCAAAIDHNPVWHLAPINPGLGDNVSQISRFNRFRPGVRELISRINFGDWSIYFVLWQRLPDKTKRFSKKIEITKFPAKHFWGPHLTRPC